MGKCFHLVPNKIKDDKLRNQGVILLEETIAIEEDIWKNPL